MTDRDPQPPPLVEPLAEPLTRRERDVLALLAEGFTGPEIAERLTLALSSVKFHIQNLYGKLGVNGKRQALTRAAPLGLLGGAQAPAAPAAEVVAPAAPPPSLPVQVTRFFGREDDIANVRATLADWRLVTLTGSGGVGKTRLSLRVAEDVQASFPDGIWSVELAAIGDPARVGLQVAASLGLSEGTSVPVPDRLANFLRERQALLVLDNCEHLLEACAWLANHLLRACPRLRLLATSREALGIAGEAVFIVPSLPYPNPRRLPDLALLDQFTALSLFVDRARAVQPDFAISQENASSVARICQRLDGIPLAIELAAARVHLLDIETLAARLDDAFQLLTSGSRTALPRHQTLRATIDWSYQLLSEPERLLLRRLAVFAGGCTLEAAEAVCSDAPGAESARPRPATLLPPSDVLDRLASLVDKSMVIASRLPGQATRYHQLEMVRQYAREKLEASGESERLSRRHWEYFLRLAEANGRALLGRERPVWIKRFEAEVENLRLALGWSFSNPADILPGITLALALQPAWFVWYRHVMFDWMIRGVELIDGGAVLPAAPKARFLAWASAVLWKQPHSRRLAEEALAISRGLGSAHLEVLCWSLWVMAVGGFYMELAPEHWDEAQALLDEQAAIIPQLGSNALIDPRLYQGYNLWLQAVLANDRGQLERARELGLESLRIFDVAGNDMHHVSPNIALGDTALRMGDYDAAHFHFGEAYRLAGDFTDVRKGDTVIFLCEVEYRRGDLARAYDYCKDSVKYSLWNFLVERLEMAARIFARAGRYREAAKLSGAAEALSEQLDRPTSAKVWGPDSHWGDFRTRFADVALDALVPNWRARPDGDAIQQAWNAGRALSEPEAQAYALGLTL